MLKDEGSLFVGVTLYTCRICADTELRLFLLEPAVGIMAVAAVHCAFEHPVAEGFTELRFCFVVTGHAKLRFIRTKHRPCRLGWSLLSYFADQGGGTRSKSGRLGSVSSVALVAADVISPVVPSTKIIMVLLSSMACKAGLGGSFSIHSFE
jgi:hypothetical protein